jgi:hypothetical protein
MSSLQRLASASRPSDAMILPGSNFLNFKRYRCLSRPYIAVWEFEKLTNARAKVPIRSRLPPWVVAAGLVGEPSRAARGGNGQRANSAGASTRYSPLAGQVPDIRTIRRATLRRMGLWGGPIPYCSQGIDAQPDARAPSRYTPSVRLAWRCRWSRRNCTAAREEARYGAVKVGPYSY